MHNVFVPDAGVSLNNVGIKTLTTKNKGQYTRRDVLRAERVRRFQHVAAHASDKTLLKIATDKSIANIPFLPREVRLANRVLGK